MVTKEEILKRDESHLKETLNRDLTPEQRESTQRELATVQLSLGKEPSPKLTQTKPQYQVRYGSGEGAIYREDKPEEEKVVTVLVGDKAVGVSEGVAKKIEQEVIPRQEFKAKRQAQIRTGKITPRPEPEPSYLVITPTEKPQQQFGEYVKAYKKGGEEALLAKPTTTVTTTTTTTTPTKKFITTTPTTTSAKQKVSSTVSKALGTISIGLEDVSSKVSKFTSQFKEPPISKEELTLDITGLQKKGVKSFEFKEVENVTKAYEESFGIKAEPGEVTLGFAEIGKKKITIEKGLPKTLKESVIAHETLHQIYPGKTEKEILELEKANVLNIIPTIKTKDIFVSPKGSEVAGAIKGVPVSKGVWDAYDKALGIKPGIKKTGYVSLLDLDRVERKPSIPSDKQSTSAITTPAISAISIDKNLSVDLKKLSESYQGTKGTQMVLTTPNIQQELEQQQIKKTWTEQAKKTYEEMSIPQKAVAHYHTLFSGAGFKYIGSPVQALVSKVSPKIESITPKDVVIEKLVQTKIEKMELEDIGKATKGELFKKGVVHAIGSPPVVVGASYLGGAGIGALGSTSLGGAVLGTTGAQATLTTVGGIGMGIAGVDVFRDIKKGEIASGVGKLSTIGASIYAGSKGFKAGQKIVDVWRTKGMAQVKTEDLIPEDVLTGKKRFPEAGTRTMTARERAIIHKELFEKESFRLPGQEKPLGFHATSKEWDELIAGKGTSELPGTYTSYGVSPHFTEIPTEAETRLFGRQTFGGKPTIYGFEPTDIRINIAEKIPGVPSKPYGWKLTQPTEAGILNVPGIKTEVEGVFKTGTLFAETGRDYWINIYGRRVPIITAKATGGIGLTVAGADVSKVSGMLPSVSQASISESLGISQYSYIITPESVLGGVGLSSLVGVSKPSPRIKTPESVVPEIKTSMPKTEPSYYDIGTPPSEIISVSKPKPSKAISPKISSVLTSSKSFPSKSVLNLSSMVSGVAPSIVSTIVSVPSYPTSLPPPSKISIPSYKPPSYKPPSYPSYKSPPPPSSRYYPPSPPYKPTPITPKKTPFKFSKPSQMKGQLIKGFDVEVRKAGKWLKVTKQPLLKTEALKLGSYIAESTPRASFRLTPSKQAPLFTSLPYEFKAERFRQPKRRGVTSPTEIFIEKSKYRIDMPGELKGITMKGLEAPRRKKLRPSRNKIKLKKKKPIKGKRGIFRMRLF